MFYKYAKLAFVILVLVLTSQLSSQEAGSLLSVISANIEADRPTYFRSMQELLQKEKLKPIEGVQLTILHDKVDELQKKVISIIDNIKIECKNDSIIIKYKIQGIYNNKLDKFNLESLENFIEEVKKNLREILPNEDSNDITKYLYVIAYNALIAQLGSRTEARDDCKNKLIDQLSLYVNHKLGEIISDKINDITEIEPEIIKSDMKQKIYDIFTEIHRLIRDEIEKPINKIIDMNIGASVVSNENSLDGGFIIKWYPQDYWKFSLYLNSQFSPTEKETRTNYLIGGQGSYFFNSFQGVFSGSFLKPDSDDKGASEYSLSLFYASPIIILGASVIDLKNSTHNFIYAFTALIKSNKIAPNFNCGLIINHGSSVWKPFFKITYPIN